MNTVNKEDRWKFIEDNLPDYYTNEDVFCCDLYQRVIDNEEVSEDDYTKYIINRKLKIKKDVPLNTVLKEKMEEIEEFLYKKAKIAIGEKIGGRIGDFSDIPEFLKKQLILNPKNDIKDKVIAVINSLDGIATIDEIIVGLYKQYNIKILKRRNLCQVLHLYKKSGSLTSPKRGCYATTKEES